MRIRWTIGGVIAALAVTLLLPGIASADHEAVVTANADCDGSFVIDADYFGSGVSSDVYVSYNGNNYDDGLDESVTDPTIDAGDIPNDMTATQDSHYVVVGSGDDYFDFAANEDADDFFTLSGTYDSVVNAGGSVIVNADLQDFTNAGIDDSATVTDGLDGSWSECVIDFCSDGDTDGGTDLSFNASPTNDCDPVRLCVAGESVTVTEFAAESLDGEKGSCTPSELAPPITTTSTETQPAVEIVEPSEAAVAEVSPAVDVAALPSAGYGDDGGINYAWVAIFALAVVGFGGATALMARPRK